MKKFIAGLALGALATIAGPALAATPNTASCGDEVPDTGVCAWDARHEGLNGQGRSYIATNGDQQFVPHWVAHRLRDLG